jgi:hypothetical protein
VAYVLSVYAIGVLIGLVMTDARPLARLALAALWPVGPLAFVAVICTLVVTAAFVFPLVGVGVLVAALLSWLWLAR